MIPDIYKGAILTFLTLVIIEFIKNLINKQGFKRNFIIFVKLELSTILKSLERIKLKLTEQNIFDFGYLNEIEKNLGDLENTRASAIYITEKNQASYFDLIVEIRTFINECRFIQSTYYNHNDLFQGRKDARDVNQIFQNQQENQNFFNLKKLEKIVSIADIKNKIDEFVKALDQNLALFEK